MRRLMWNMGGWIYRLGDRMSYENPISHKLTAIGDALQVKSGCSIYSPANGGMLCACCCAPLYLYGTDPLDVNVCCSCGRASRESEEEADMDTTTTVIDPR